MLDFCAIMSLPPPLAAAFFSRNLKAASGIMVAEAERKMTQAASRVRNLVLARNPDAGENDEDNAISVAISIDGSWQKRGFSSRYGVVTAILIDTGEVIDYEIMSKHCFECQKHANINKDSKEYREWKMVHDKKCNINYYGSSGGMEGAGAVAIYKRSIKMRKLKYTKFVGDGDSDTFKIVREEMEKVYGSRYLVQIEECVGHVQKRMGNALRKYVKDMKGKKLLDDKSVSGKGRLTQLKIDRIQRNYGEAIRKNTGSLKEMQNAVWAIFHHMIKPPSDMPLSIQHRFCPKGENSWCKFNSNLESRKTTYNEEHRLPSVFFNELKPIFTRLASIGLLQKCLLGLTQNQNESFNNLVWQRCPKGLFCSKERIVAAVAEAVCVYNTGAGAKAQIVQANGIQNVGSNLMKAMHKKDEMRLVSASAKVTEKYKAWRLNRKKRATEDRKVANVHYEPGAFDSQGMKTGYKRKREQYSAENSKKQKIYPDESRAEGAENSSSFEIVKCGVEDIQITIPKVLDYIKAI